MHVADNFPQFYVAVSPIGQNLGDAEGWFNTYLALPVVLVFWIGGLIWKRKGWVRIADIDVDTGRREHDWDDINAHRQHLATLPAWRRLFHAVF